MAANLRSYRADDAVAVLTLSRHALARTDEQVGKPLWATREDLESELSTWGGSPDETLRVVEEDGEVAAFGGLQPGGDPTVVGPLVAPSFRGRKMGRMLLDAAIDLARVNGRDWIGASVGPRNAGGRLLLERKGFRPREGLDAVYRLFPADHRPAGPAPPGVDVRPGVPGDLAAVWALYRMGFPAGRRTEEVWLQWLESGEVVVADRDDRVVAIVHLEPGARSISHVGVAEEARGLGVGGYLFSRVIEDYWRTNPERALRLSVLRYNTPAIRLYRRLGFAPWLVLRSFELEL